MESIVTEMSIVGLVRYLFPFIKDNLFVHDNSVSLMWRQNFPIKPIILL